MKICSFPPKQIDDEDEEEPEKPSETGEDSEAIPEAKQPETVNDDDEPMAEAKTDENLNNGSPNDENASQKGNNEADDSKELAEGELADLSGDESKATDAPETIDLGMILIRHFFLPGNLRFSLENSRIFLITFLSFRRCSKLKSKKF